MSSSLIETDNYLARYNASVLIFLSYADMDDNQFMETVDSTFLYHFWRITEVLENVKKKKKIILSMGWHYQWENE